jgi:uncharacterized protein YoxC
MTPPFLPALGFVLEAAWVGPTMAISLVLIALSFVAIALVAVLLGKGAAKAFRKMSQELGELRGELRPAITSVRNIAEEAEGLASNLKSEVHEIIRTSSEVRHDVRLGVDRVRERLEDLDALAEVMQEELEDTAIDVASRVRSVRSGFGIVGRLRRLLRPRSRR